MSSWDFHEAHPVFTSNKLYGCGGGGFAADNFFFPENEEARQILSAWGLSLTDSCIAFEGRIHNPEPIRFGSTEVQGSEGADWGREACREKVITPVSIQGSTV